MPHVEIYTTALCPYCYRAKALLKKKGVAFTEYDVDAIPGKRDEMAKRSGGRRTVPQIFIDGAHVGDCDEIHALDAKGLLDAKLGLRTAS